MSKRKRPDLSINTGTWINPNFLSDTTRCELLDVFLSTKGKTVEPRVRNSLVDFANAYLQYRTEKDDPTSVIRDQLAQLAERAHKLLESMETLRRSTLDELHARLNEASKFGEPAIDPEIAYRMARDDETRFLDAAWDHVNALAFVADSARASVEARSTQNEFNQDEVTSSGKLSRQDKPDQIQARWLVAETARCYMQLTSTIVPKGATISRFGEVWPEGARVPGEPPPKNPAGWFADFVSVLGNKTGVKIGPRLVKSGVELALTPVVWDEDVDRRTLSINAISQ